MIWANAYDARYDELRREGRLQRSTPDSEKIFEQISSELNPVDIAKDKVNERLLKRLLPRLAVVIEWANKPIVEALKAFFDSSEIASDYDELRLMNDELQRRIFAQLTPYLQDDWKQNLEHAASNSVPNIRRP